MTTTLLWDSDILAYKFALRHEESVDWDGDGVVTRWCDSAAAIEDLNEHVIWTEELLGADESVMVLSDTEANFRKVILPTYKSNRKGAQKPIAWKQLRDHMRDAWTSYVRPGLEADDVCGILATSTKIVRGHTIIVSIDKDFGCIPATCWGGAREDNGDPILTHPTEAEADYFHLFQTLTGDIVDGYTGCPGIGPKAARVILDSPRRFVSYDHTFKSGPRKGTTETRWRMEEEPCTRWESIVSAFEKAGHTEEYALQQARVARILRAGDYNFRTKEPILWTPSS